METIVENRTFRDAVVVSIESKRNGNSRTLATSLLTRMVSIESKRNGNKSFLKEVTLMLFKVSIESKRNGNRLFLNTLCTLNNSFNRI